MGYILLVVYSDHLYKHVNLLILLYGCLWYKNLFLIYMLCIGLFKIRNYIELFPA